MESAFVWWRRKVGRGEKKKKKKKENSKKEEAKINYNNKLKSQLTEQTREIINTKERKKERKKSKGKGNRLELSSRPKRNLQRAHNRPFPSCRFTLISSFFILYNYFRDSFVFLQTQPFDSSPFFLSFPFSHSTLILFPISFVFIFYFTQFLLIQSSQTGRL